MNKKQTSIAAGSLLIAGTSIGGGMLALPVLTSVSGFIPSLAVYFFCWFFMACTGLLFLEIAQSLHRDANIVSMAERTLGKAGKIFAWVLYLFLFYCLTVAYIVGCGSIVVSTLNDAIPDWLGPILFLMLFSPLILIQTSLAGRLNIGLMTGLIISYFAFVIFGFSYVDVDLLKFADWGKTLRALPIAFTAFAYQGTIPTLINFMNDDISRSRKAILIGSFIPFIAYAIWQWLILGIIPIEGPWGLSDALAKGQNAVQPLRHFITTGPIYLIGQFFAFFALVTSFLGVALGLRDFLADGLGIKKTLSGKAFIALMIFIPSLLIAILHPHIFLVALEYAGGLGCALLLGLLPILMVWKSRYYQGNNQNHQLFGGKWLMLLLAAFVLFEVTLEIKRIFF